jgi:hypothetical protein
VFHVQCCLAWRGGPNRSLAVAARLAAGSLGDAVSSADIVATGPGRDMVKVTEAAPPAAAGMERAMVLAGTHDAVVGVTPSGVINSWNPAAGAVWLPGRGDHRPQCR